MSDIYRIAQMIDTRKCLQIFCVVANIYKHIQIWIILMSLFSTSRLYRDRMKPANGTQCPTLMTDSFYMHNHIDMITHGTTFVELVGGTDK